MCAVAVACSLKPIAHWLVFLQIFNSTSIYLACEIKPINDRLQPRVLENTETLLWLNNSLLWRPQELFIRTLVKPIRRRKR